MKKIKNLHSRKNSPTMTKLTELKTSEIKLGSLKPGKPSTYDGETVRPLQAYFTNTYSKGYGIKTTARVFKKSDKLYNFRLQIDEASAAVVDAMREHTAKLIVPKYTKDLGLAVKTPEDLMKMTAYKKLVYTNEIVTDLDRKTVHSIYVKVFPQNKTPLDLQLYDRESNTLKTLALEEQDGMELKGIAYVNFQRISKTNKDLEIVITLDKFVATAVNKAPVIIRGPSNEEAIADLSEYPEDL